MAVVVNDVHFNHRELVENNYTLKGVNMNVPVGSIYGLLGPSGCGKTTLLKCIIGFLQPCFGMISVFGNKPGDERSGVPGGGIGYMPQEIAIQYDLTIEEILTYFGKINFLNSEHLTVEIDNFVNILHLSDKQTMIGELSGGQKRRVSLAIAMLHKPRLLILDEPTVGVDPILSDVIWNFMITLSSTLKTTIIITTHYISETNKANCVAFMRNGLIVEECNPKILLQKYEAQCLDDAFLKLCEGQMHKRKTADIPQTDDVRKSGFPTCSVKKPYSQQETSYLKRFSRVLYAIVWKYLIETRKNYFAILLVVITTISIVLCVKLVVGQTPRDLQVAWVVDEQISDFFSSNHSIPNNNSEIQKNAKFERTNYSNNSNSFDNYTEIENVVTDDEDYDDVYGDLYLPNILKKSINANIIKLVEYSTLSSAMKDAKKLIVHGIIYLKSNFSRNYLMCDPLFSEVDDYVTNDTIDSGSIHVYLDYANLFFGHTIRSAIASSLQPFRKLIGEQLNVTRNLLSSPIIIQPINFEDRYINSVEDIFSVATFITPGVVVFNSFSLCVGLCILSLLKPLECDMFVREYASGVKPVHILLGQVVARFIFMFFNAILNLLAMIYILNVPCRGSVTLVLILIWMQMLLGLSIGVFMSSSMSSSYYSLYTAIAFTISLFASNGIIWGIEAQPYYMKWLMQYSPLYYSTNALRAMLAYSNASFHVIWPGFAFTSVWIGVTFFGAVCVVSMKK